jgi:hypothetical protein
MVKVICRVVTAICRARAVAARLADRLALGGELAASLGAGD